MESGKVVALYDGFTFYKRYRRKGELDVWNCSRFPYCKSTLLLDQHQNMHEMNIDHNHGKRELIQTRDARKVTFRNGKRRLFYKGYTFFKHYQTKSRVKWSCSRSPRCRAFINTKDDDDLIVRQFGNSHNHDTQIYQIDIRFYKKASGKTIAILEGYTFCRKVSGKKTETWQCSSGNKCRSLFVISKDDLKVVRKNLVHQHVPPRHYINNAQLITTYNGKMLLSYKGYCYTKTPNTKNSWRCIHTSFCYRSLYVDSNLIVVREPKEHVHPPKRFYRNYDGIYYSAMRVITTINDKRLLRYKGHYYSKAPYLTNRWRCINTNNCYVGMVVNNDLSVKKEPREHHHQPKIYIETANGKYRLTDRSLRLSDYIDELTSITVYGGKKYYLYRNYPYTIAARLKNGWRWRCTNTRTCKAYIIVEDSGTLTKEAHEHLHPPPRLEVDGDGVYRLVRSKFIKFMN